MSNGMSNEEGLFRLYLDKVYTCTLGRVTEVMEGRFCKFQLIAATNLEKDLPIVLVPVGRWLGTSSPVTVGMVLPIYFSKWSLDEYFVNRQDKITGTPVQELQFSRNDAFALPMVFDDMMDDDFPSEIRFHQRPIFEEGAEFTKDIQVNDKINATGDIESLTKVKAPIGEFDNVTATNEASIGGKDFSTHKHTNGTAGDGNTGTVV